MPKRNFKKFPRRGTIASDDQNDALWWAAAEGKLDLVEGALKKGWSLKRDPFDVVKDDPYAGIEYDRAWSDPQYELVMMKTLKTTDQRHCIEQQFLTMASAPKRFARCLLMQDGIAKKLTRMVTHRQMMLLLVMSI